MTSKKAIPPVHHCLPKSIPMLVTILAGDVYKHSVIVTHRLAGNNNHIHRLTIILCVGTFINNDDQAISPLSGDAVAIVRFLFTNDRGPTSVAQKGLIIRQVAPIPRVGL